MPYPKGKPKVDLTGQKFDRLTVVKKTDKRKFRCIVWECICDCGNAAYIPSKNLINGNSGSCGCRTIENQHKAVALPIGESEFNRVIRVYKSNAKKRGIDFRLSKNEMRALTQNRCYYCDARPYSNSSAPESNGEYIYNGVDRVDSDGPYDTGNVVTCCKKCNRAKRDLSQREFAQLVSRIHGHALAYAGSASYWIASGVMERYGPGWKNDSGIVYKSYKYDSRKKERVFDLDRKTFFLLTQSNCFYCGVEPSNTKIEKRLASQGYKKDRIISYTHNGIDRVDSSLGYTASNVVPCCKYCNIAKRDMSVNEFVTWANQVYNHWAKDFLK